MSSTSASASSSPNSSAVNALNYDGVVAALLERLRSRDLDDASESIPEVIAREASQRARDLAHDEFSLWLRALYRALGAQSTSSSSVEKDKVWALQSLAELVTQMPERDAPKELAPLLASLHAVLARDKLDAVVESAARAFGRIAAVRAPALHDHLDAELRTALEWLEALQERRLAAVLIIAQLAVHAPSTLYVHANATLLALWRGLHDGQRDAQGVRIREASASALRSVLAVVAMRGSTVPAHAQWYQAAWDSVAQGASKNVQDATAHGSLLALGEMLRDSGGAAAFIRDKERYKDASALVLSRLNASSKPVPLRQSALSALAALAAHSPERFVTSELSVAMKQLFTSLKDKSGSDRRAAFSTLGALALAVGERPQFSEHVAPLVEALVAGLSPSARNKPVSSSATTEALECVRDLATALPSVALAHHAHALLSAALSTGLSRALVAALKELQHRLPGVARVVQLRLLDLIARVLTGRPFQRALPSGLVGSAALTASGAAPPPPPSSSSAPPSAPGSGSGSGDDRLSAASQSTLTLPSLSQQNSAEVLVALDTLRSFPFERALLGELARSGVLPYLRHELVAVRHAAVSTCAHLVSDARSGRHARHIAHDVLAELLHALVADRVRSIRRSVLLALPRDADPLLATPRLLPLLLASLHDEDAAVRELALALVARLAPLNAGVVLPPLRALLVQLLRALELGDDVEHVARSLALLLSSSTSLVRPYVKDVLAALLTKASDPEARVATQALAALSELCARSPATLLMPHVDSMLALVADTLPDQSSSAKRLSAARLLTAVVRSSGCAVEPLWRDPRLLPLLLQTLRSDPEVRVELVRVLGVLGAVDPFRLRSVSKDQGGSGTAVTTEDALKAPEAPLQQQQQAEGAGDTPVTQEEGAHALLAPSTHSRSSEEYYAAVAIESLLGVLRDASLAQHHAQCLTAFMLMFKRHPARLLPHLAHVLPQFLAHLRQEPQSREFVLQQLAELVSAVHLSVRPHVDSLLAVARAQWQQGGAAPLVLALLHSLSSALGQEFQPYVAQALPYFTAALHAPSMETHDVRAAARQALLCIQGLGVRLAPHLHALVPAVSRLLDLATTSKSSATASVTSPSLDAASPLALVRTALDTLAVLATRLDLAAYAAQLLPPMARLMERLATIAATKESESVLLVTLDTVAVLVRALGVSACLPWVSQLREASAKVSQSAKVSSVKCTSTLAALSAAASHTSRQMLLAELADSDTETSHHLPTPSPTSNALSASSSNEKLSVNEARLRAAWDAGSRSTADDWQDWLRALATSLLRESPSPSLRACHAVADHFPLVRSLFHAAFLSCWGELRPAARTQLVQALELALHAHAMPAELVQSLLDLAEFMEHDEQPLPIDLRSLATLAEQCRAYAKALRYYEQLFAQERSQASVAALIAVNTQLAQHEAARGVLLVSRKPATNTSATTSTTTNSSTNSISSSSGQVSAQLQRGSLNASGAALAPPRPQSSAPVSVPLEAAVLDEEWYEKLGRYSEALAGYRRSWDQSEQRSAHALLGMLRALQALGEWQAIGTTCRELWASGSSSEGEATAIDALDANAKASTLAPRTHMPESSSATSERRVRWQVAAIAAKAAWHVERWDEVRSYTLQLEPGSLDGSFMRAILHLHHGDLLQAQQHIDVARALLHTGLSALVGESYQRAYSLLVSAQELAELEEIIELKRIDSALARDALASALTSGGGGGEGGEEADPSGSASESQRVLLERRLVLRSMWDVRLDAAARDVDTWRRLLRVRALALAPVEDVSTWLRYARVCRHAGRLGLAHKALDRVWEDPIGARVSSELALTLREPHSVRPLPLERAAATLGALKLAWAKGDSEAALAVLTRFVHSLATPLAAQFTPREELALLQAKAARTAALWLHGTTSSLQGQGQGQGGAKDALALDQALAPVLLQLQLATQYAPTWPKAWQSWAMMHYEALRRHRDQLGNAAAKDLPRRLVRRHAVAAVSGFLRALSLTASQSGSTRQKRDLQDVLLVLSLFFDFAAEVEAAILEHVDALPVEHWLQVTPQLIARLHVASPSVRRVLHALLRRVGQRHPQALVYALSVAAASRHRERSAAARSLLAEMEGTLVAQAQLVARELIRVSILWNEQWHEGLEEASRKYFGEHDVSAMLEVLAPLHAAVNAGPGTLHEAAFHGAFAKDLEKAEQWCRKYVTQGEKVADLNRAWDLYYHVFRRIDKQLPQLTQLELDDVAPQLLAARDMALAVPGTYRAGRPVTSRIARFERVLKVIASKQRPRKLTVYGADARAYSFLLKGHEDLRQDERVMQLFGLVNALLKHDARTLSHDHAIERYAVIPLSANSGLIGWVPHSDTMHQLIRDYRQQRQVVLNLEHRVMTKIAPDYDKLPLVQRVEVFAQALEETSGNDLERILWLRAPSSEQWMLRRALFTRSLAVMSMVGHVLGLGDRHPSNLMLDRNSGRIIHIDFGDCFEVAMKREKFPERIPFRLTRMLVMAMEVSGIEGTFRLTCEAVMAVLREHSAGLMAVLEAFVHDPLINWALLTTSAPVSAATPTSSSSISTSSTTTTTTSSSSAAGVLQGASTEPRDEFGSSIGRPERRTSMTSHHHLHHVHREHYLGGGGGGDGAGGGQGEDEGEGVAPEELNQRALAVIRRIKDKLSGNDFAHHRALSVEAQVELLIQESSAVENLCSCYVGWCAFW